MRWGIWILGNSGHSSVKQLRPFIHYVYSIVDSVLLGCHNIPFSVSARNLGFILDSRISMMKHVIKVCQTVYFQIRRIGSIRTYLTEDATKTLITFCILSRLDYCNCLLMGAPNSII